MYKQITVYLRIFQIIFKRKGHFYLNNIGQKNDGIPAIEKLKIERILLIRSKISSYKPFAEQ